MDGMILTFGLSAEEQEVLTALCRQTELQLRPVALTEYGNPLGAFVGLIPVKQWEAAAPLREKMLVFAFVPDAMLQYLLGELRRQDVAVGSYKAVLTQNNLFWTPVELFEELRREREELGDY